MIEPLAAIAAVAAVCVCGCLSYRRKAAEADVLDWFLARAPKDLTLLVLEYYIPPNLVVEPQRGPVTIYDHLTAPTQLPSLCPSPGATVLISRGWVYCIGSKCARLGLSSRELQFLSPAPDHVFCPALIHRGEKLLALTWEQTRWPQTYAACRKIDPENDRRKVRRTPRPIYDHEDEWHLWLDELDLRSGTWHERDCVTTTLARASCYEAMWIDTDALGFGGLLAFGDDFFFLSIADDKIDIHRLTHRPACESLGRWPTIGHRFFPFSWLPDTQEKWFELAAKLHGDSGSGSTQTCAYGLHKDMCTVLVQST